MSPAPFVPMAGAVFVDRLPRINFRPDERALSDAIWERKRGEHFCAATECEECRARIRACSRAVSDTLRPLGVFEALRWGENARFEITDDGRAALAALGSIDVEGEA